jgi:O-antigen/teichoic acid export membrane protein
MAGWLRSTPGPKREDGATPAAHGLDHGGRRRIVAANALANLVRGASSSLLNLVLPLALIRLFSIQEYAVWVLVFSVSLYAVYLDLGLQSSISTLVARAHAAGDDRLAMSYVAASMRMITVVSVAIFAGYVAVATNIRSLFPEIPHSLAASAGWAMVLLGGAQIVVLYSTVFVGYFSGLQRSHVPAKTITLGRVGVFLATFSVALTGAGVTPTALAYLATTVLYFVILMRSYRTETHGRIWRITAENVLRRLLALTGVLGVFSVCMLFISGLDVAIVARFSYRDLAPYGVAASLSALVIGVFGAVLSPLLPEFSRMAQQGRTFRLVDVLIKTSGMVTQALLALVAISVVASPTVLKLIAGESLATPAYALTILLVAAAASRTSAIPMTVAVVALRQRRTILLFSALSETAVNLVVSVVLCRQIGAAGVAIGTIAGAWTGIAAMALVVVPRCAELRARRGELVVQSWLLPMLRMTPALAAAAIAYYAVGPIWFRSVAIVVGGSLSLWLAWRSVHAWSDVGEIRRFGLVRRLTRAE